MYGRKILTVEENIRWYEEAISRTLIKIDERGNDNFGALSYSIANDYICLAKLHMRFNGNAERFRSYIKQVWDTYKKLLEKKEKSKNEKEELFLQTNYQEIMLFLSAGLINESVEYSRILFDYYQAKSLKERDSHIFIILMIHTFYRLILNEPGCEEWIQKFYERCAKPSGEKCFIGFVKIMDGIYKRNGTLIEAGFADILKLKGSIKRSNIDSTGNKDFCYWGIGFANLAISRGIQFTVPKDPYFPQQLLMPYSK